MKFPCEIRREDVKRKSSGGQNETVVEKKVN